MRSFKHIDLLISFLLVFFIFSSRMVKAIEYMHIGGKPANPNPAIENSESWFIYQLNPGESKQDALIVLNNFDTSLDLLVYAADGVKSSSGGFALKQLVEEKKEIGAWVKFYPNPVPEIFQELFLESEEDIVQFCALPLAESGDWAEDEISIFNNWCQGQESVELNVESLGNQVIDFVFAVPEGIEVGEYTGGMLIQKIEPEQTAVEGGVTLTTRVGVRIYQTVPGDIVKELAILKFELKKLYKEFDFKNWFCKDRPIQEILLSTAVQNLGNVSVNFSENLIIKDELFNKRGATIGDRNFQALRNDIFVSSYSWTRPLFGKYSFINQITYLDSNNIEQSIISDSITLWLIPWREIFIALAVIIILLLIRFLAKKIKKKRS